MSTVVAVIAVLIFAGPCTLAYFAGKNCGKAEGYAEGKRDAWDEAFKSGWIPNPKR